MSSQGWSVSNSISVKDTKENVVLVDARLRSRTMRFLMALVSPGVGWTATHVNADLLYKLEGESILLPPVYVPTSQILMGANKGLA